MKRSICLTPPSNRCGASYAAYYRKEDLNDKQIDAIMKKIRDESGTRCSIERYTNHIKQTDKHMNSVVFISQQRVSRKLEMRGR